MVYGLQIDRSLILGYLIEVHTDHCPLVWLLQVSNPNSRIARWQTLISEYNITATYTPGRENVIADFLSCMKEQKSMKWTSDDSLVTTSKEMPEMVNTSNDPEGKPEMDCGASGATTEMTNTSAERSVLIALLRTHTRGNPHKERHSYDENEGDMRICWDVSRIKELQEEQTNYALVKELLKMKGPLVKLGDASRNERSWKRGFEGAVVRR